MQASKSAGSFVIRIAIYIISPDFFADNFAFYYYGIDSEQMSRLLCKQQVV
jgi:hypothetical protein